MYFYILRKTNKTMEKKTALVVYISFLAMVIEITAGIVTHSMALLADGIHMLSHVGAIGLSWFAYRFARKYENDVRLQTGTGKIIELAGYTSGLILLFFAVFIVVQSVNRLLNPETIMFKEAMIVACSGLVVNIISAIILHHDEEKSDHNIKAAYLHVIADALTSVVAILGLLAGWIFNFYYLDSIGGLISSVVIIKWSISLLRKTGIELLDIKPIQKK